MSYTRLTILGSQRKADIVLPGDEPVGSLVPQILDVLGEGVRGGQAIALTTLDGTALELGKSLGEQDIGHGALVRLTALDDAPQAPDVMDVTDAVADAMAGHRGQWTPLASTVTCALLAGTACGLASWTLLRADRGVLGSVLIACLALTIIATLSARRDRPAAATAAATAAAGGFLPWSEAALQRLAPPLVQAFPMSQPLVTSCLLWIVIALVLGAGRGKRSAVAAAIIGVLCASIVLVLVAIGTDQRGIITIAAAVCMAALGLLPGLALSMSGLTGFDDRVIGGERIARRDVGDAIGDAFDALSWTTLAIAIPAAAMLMLLARSQELWQLGLAAAIAIVIALRARVLPLIVQRALLLIVAVVPVITWLLTPTPLAGAEVQALTAAAGAALAIAIASLRFNELAAARLRRAADVAELFAVLAVVPVLLGALGIYADLYEVFG